MRVQAARWLDGSAHVLPLFFLYLSLSFFLLSPLSPYSLLSPYLYPFPPLLKGFIPLAGKFAWKLIPQLGKLLVHEPPDNQLFIPLASGECSRTLPLFIDFPRLRTHNCVTHNSQVPTRPTPSPLLWKKLPPLNVLFAFKYIWIQRYNGIPLK